MIRRSGQDCGAVHAHHRQKEIQRVRQKTLEFKKKWGRRPRILIARIHDGDSDRIAKVIATQYADLGFDVDMHTYVQPPERIAKIAVENDVHIIGTVEAPQKTMAQELMSRLANALQKEGGQGILIAAHGPEGFGIRLPPGGSKDLKEFDLQETVARYALHLLKEIEKIAEPTPSGANREPTKGSDHGDCGTKNSAVKEPRNKNP